MSEPQDSASLPEDLPTIGVPPEELPPVQPPSAGFIMQLFLIPAIIVAAVVGIWVMFGRIASSEQDWKTLVVDLGSKNEHRRWRAASSLAAMLNADRLKFDAIMKMPESERPPLEEAPLASNPQVVDELVRLFDEQLRTHSTKAKDIAQQEFLARTLGALSLPDRVLPALRRAVEGDYDDKVRTSALSSICLVVHRSGPTDALDDLVSTLIASSADPVPLVRQSSAYALGLIASDSALEHLIAMLADADLKTRVNAAIGLARNDRAGGVDVFMEVLRVCRDPLDTDRLKSMNHTDRQLALNEYRIERPMMLNNTLRALRQLSKALTAEQKTTAMGLLEPIASGYEHPDLRTSAARLLDEFRS